MDSWTQLTMATVNIEPPLYAQMIFGSPIQLFYQWQRGAVEEAICEPRSEDITACGSRYAADFGFVAKQMMTLVEDNIANPTLREWILPNFSTTTFNDPIVSSMVVLLTMKVSNRNSFS